MLGYRNNYNATSRLVWLICMWAISVFAKNAALDYDQVNILGLCDSDIHVDCLEAFAKVLPSTNTMGVSQSLSFNWSVIKTKKDFATGLREMDGVCSKYRYHMMVAFGVTQTMMTAALTAETFNITLLAYDTTPGHILNLKNSMMVQMNRSPYYSGEAMALLLSRFNYYWVAFVYQDTYLDDGFLGQFLEDGGLYGIKVPLNISVSLTDNWMILQNKMKNIQQSAFKTVLLHCDVFLMKRVVQVGKLLNLFSHNYAWFLSDFATEHNQLGDYSLPIGLVGLKRTRPYGYLAQVENVLRTMVDRFQINETSDFGYREFSLNDLINDSYIFNTSSLSWARDLKLSLETSGEILDYSPQDSPNYTYQILNLVQNQKGSKLWEVVGVVDNFYVNLSTVAELPGRRENVTHRFRKLYRILTKVSPPFIMQKEAFSEDGDCYSYVPCVQVANESDIDNAFEDYLLTKRYDHNKFHVSCCTGVTIDILVKLATDIEFDFILFFLKEPFDGSYTNSSGSWNDTLMYLENDSVDIVAGPLSITVARVKFITFTEVYFYTGFSMINMKRERETSMGAFLMPFSVEVWIGIAISATVTAVATSLFEWNSPFGLNPRGRKRERNYTLGSALTMVYSVLFGHIVRTKSPKSWPGKVLQNFWAGLAIFMIASYTANLAAYLAGRSEQSDLLSINDKRLQSMRVATFNNGAAKYFLSKINPSLYSNLEMSVNSMVAAIQKLKSNEIDIFIHDTYILKFAISWLDESCAISFAGESFGQDGYAFGLKKGSKLSNRLSDKILTYTSSGYIEELTKKYFSQKGCDNQRALPLEIKYGPQHTAGLFVLLLVAVTISIFLMVGEYLFFKYLIPFLRKKPATSRWKSINIMFLSQRFFRTLNSEQLVSPQSTAREIIHIVRNRDFAKFFQKDEIKTTKALRRNQLPQRNKDIFNLATTMIRTQKAETYVLPSDETLKGRAENPNTFCLSGSDQCSAQNTPNEQTKEICLVESSSSVSDKTQQTTGPNANSSFISVLGEKSKESPLNEEHILINVLQTEETPKSGIENPAFMNRDAVDRNLRKKQAAGTSSKQHSVTEGSDSNTNPESLCESSSKNVSSVRNSGARIKLKTNTSTRLVSPSPSVRSYDRRSRYHHNENNREKNGGSLRNNNRTLRAVVSAERLMRDHCNSKDNLSRDFENRNDGVDYGIDDSDLLSGSDEWEFGNQSSANSSQSSVFATTVRLENASDWSAGDETISAGSSKSGSKDSACALLGVPPSEYYKRSLKMKDNRVKSTIRHHALRGVRPLLPASMIDECTIEALSKEDLLVMWKSSEIELQKKLGEVIEQKEKLKRLIEQHSDQTEV
ncbi:glutamate receptor ionotropic, NMDA 3A-like [Argonauta hians]